MHVIRPLVFVCVLVMAEVGFTQTIRMDLDQCIERALLVSPDIEQAELALAGLEAKASEARYAGILPQFQMTNILGPAPGVKGDEDSLDTIRNDLGDLGVYARTRLEVLQPIYTFGKLEGAREASRHGLEAGEAGVEKKKSDIVLQVKKLYYGLVLAKVLREVVIEAQDNVVKARERVNELIEEDSGDVGQNDLLKIDVFEFEVFKNLARADKSIHLGRAALMMTLGIDRSADFDVTSTTLEPEPRELEELEVYISRAYDTRSDIKQLRAGLLAKRSLLRVSRSDYYPQIAIGGFIEHGYAPNRPHFSNPFLNDQFNFFRGGVAITLRQSFSFGLTRAKHQAQQAEYLDLMSKEEQAMKAIALEVERAYRDVEEAKENVMRSDRAMRSAKAWMTSVGIGYDITGDSAEVIDAYTAYARMRQEYYQSVFNLNVALAGLDHVTGVGVAD